ncbi:MAG: cobyrinate a,c-diamide synthase [Deltaproteobacteria bacterium]|nr:cobyrinate a,c-diamide synthase [Deltaproteobacteria bacterium]MBW2151657.1 cobyrinate a,c-diamide synthase [Deltaproteobacteria bacterium]
MSFPRVILAALRGGAGKTILSAGIIASWTAACKKIAVFKKGPDYIDAGWLALAAGRPCYNLDTFLVSAQRIYESFLYRSTDCDIAFIEGNRGLFDGIDIKGSTSTAELAKLLKTPVILCLDCTKTTRTLAAVVEGCIRFDPDVEIKGVILNRVAGVRHETILRKSIEHHCKIPVLGAVPKLSEQNFPERHMGLVPAVEHERAAESISQVSLIAKKYLDLQAIEKIARQAVDIFLKNKAEKRLSPPLGRKKETLHRQKPRIGIIRDTAFQFYYPENIEALTASGAELVFFSPLKGGSLPEIDALYIGGGFPETHATLLAENKEFRSELKSLAASGLPIYAECGGLMYLARELVLKGKVYPMADVLPIVFGVSERPRGHGYTVIHVEKENPFFKTGIECRGHEFHYSTVLDWWGDEDDFAFVMKRGMGILKKRDGLLYKNVLATYTHLHALGVPFWSEAIVSNARERMKTKK